MNLFIGLVTILFAIWANGDYVMSDDRMASPRLYGMQRSQSRQNPKQRQFRPTLSYADDNDESKDDYAEEEEEEEESAAPRAMAKYPPDPELGFDNVNFLCCLEIGFCCSVEVEPQY